MDSTKEHFEDCFIHDWENLSDNREFCRKCGAFKKDGKIWTEYTVDFEFLEDSKDNHICLSCRKPCKMTYIKILTECKGYRGY